MQAITLAPLREELSLHPGPSLSTGEPSHTLEDPVRNQFFRIDWLTFEILARWSLGNARDIADSVSAATTLAASEDDVMAVAGFMNDNQLLRPDPVASSKTMAARRRAMSGPWHRQLLHHYLFFRIPLLKPDRRLGRVAPAFDWFYSAAFARVTLLALLFGAVQVYRDWDHFSATLVDTLTPGGLLAYAFALTGVKCLHELGHAMTAKRYGCRVPTMGLAFLVLWPVPYTDTNDTWRLGNKRSRQHVAAAGVATELVIAAWATLAWVLLPDGLLRSIAFPLATTTWLATLAINTSPFMRFDGYFVLSDWLDLPNMHGRAFALARWHLREVLFGVGAPRPELFSRRRHVGMILFAWGTWLYRVALFLGIAVLVYHFFIKIVGLFLFAVEISWFVLKPIASEVHAWRALWPQIRQRRRTRVSLFLAALLVVLLFVPMPTRIQATALLHPEKVFTLHAPLHAQVAQLPVAEGGRVAAGQVMMRLATSEGESQRKAVEARIERLRWQGQTAGFDAEQRRQSGVLAEQLASAEAELAALREDAAFFSPLAPFAGRLRDIEPELAPGVWVGRNERLAVLVADGPDEVDTYLEEGTAQGVAIGQSARFYADGLEGPFVEMKVAAIDKDASHTLPGGLWAAQLGGSVAAREKQGIWYPEHAVYHVRFALTGPAGALEGRSWRGKVVIAGHWEAPGARFVRAFFGVFWREFGF
ncbi:MAG: secretion protein HylD [Massilia sp.]